MLFSSPLAWRVVGWQDLPFGVPAKPLRVGLDWRSPRRGDTSRRSRPCRRCRGRPPARVGGDRQLGAHARVRGFGRSRGVLPVALPVRGGRRGASGGPGQGRQDHKVVRSSASTASSALPPQGTAPRRPPARVGGDRQLGAPAARDRSAGIRASAGCACEKPARVGGLAPGKTVFGR